MTSAILLTSLLSLRNVYIASTSFTDTGLARSSREEVISKLVVDTRKLKLSLAHVKLPQFSNSTLSAGPGELGLAVKVKREDLTGEEQIVFDEGWKRQNFNEFVSRQISVFRQLPDCDITQICKSQSSALLANTQISVIIIFHNEAWSTLLRSIHSVLERTPADLLLEVLLVDDASELLELQSPLDKYLLDIPKVKVIRSTSRGGLTKARLLGFEASKASIVVFLDSHIECFPGWAEPMISRIEQDRRRVVYPIIESINPETFSISCRTEATMVGGFKIHTGHFMWDSVPQGIMKNRSSKAEPLRSPTMPGGLFAIDRDFFTQLGTYDPDLTYWGGENLELSFKIWQCGGSIELLPCSRVGHIFRPTVPSRWNSTRDEFRINTLRVADVWMDGYRNYFHEAINYVLPPIGDTSARHSLRQSLQCHDFDWYIVHVYPELVDRLPTQAVRIGHITSRAGQEWGQCVDSYGGQGTPGMYPCHDASQNQVWYLDTSGDLHFGDLYLCGLPDGTVGMSRPWRCQGGGEHWRFTHDNTLVHQPSSQCLTSQGEKLVLQGCSDSDFQKWNFPLRRTDIVFPVPRSD